MKFPLGFILVSLFTLLSVLTASAQENVWLEAECGSVGSLWNTLSDGNASNGEFATIQSGNNSTGSPPTSVNDRISYGFSVTESDNYTVWGRVIAPNFNDDSFWVRMDGGSWIQWNNIAQGSSWHWDEVHDAQNGNTVVSFNLASGSHTFDVAYREDGTQIDKIYITNSSTTPSGQGSTATNCAGQPQPPIANAGSDQSVTDSDGNGTETVSLDGSGSNDPDGTIVSYVWTEGGSQIATGATPSVSLSVGTHNITLTVTDNDNLTDSDNVTITVSPGGGMDVHVWLEAECGSVGLLWNTNSDGNASNNEYVTIQSGNNSTGSAPGNTDGHINYNFSVNSNGNYIVWGRVISPSGSDDSFWVRMDGGSWIQWNNIPQGSSWHWDDVHDSQNGGATVNFNLGNGSHTLTVAYREDGTQLDKLYITNTTDTPTGQGSAANNCSSQPPMANAGPDQSVTDSDGNGSETVSLNGSGSNDPGGTIVSYVWTEGGNQIATGATASVNLSVGTHNITLTVTDNDNLTDTDNVTITVSAQQLQAPTANAGPDQTVTDDDGNGSETVALNGSGSSDPDGTIVSYVWTEGGSQIATGATPSVSLSVGTHNITLTVTDNDNLTDSDNVTITVNPGGTDVHVWLEAECGSIGSLWITNSDGNASSSEYVTIQSGNNSTGSAPGNTDGHINYNFSVNSSGNYIVWGRVISPSGSDDSFWVRMDGGSWIQWNNIPQGSSWHWDDVHDSQNGGATVNFNLGNGSHTLTVAYREDGTQLDKLYITNTSDTPTGQGSAASNCVGPPVANAGPDQTVTDNDDNGSESVTLDGSGSSDPGGSIISYVWEEGGGQIATGATPNVNLSVGTHNITLTVTDNDNFTDSDNVTITVNPAGGGECDIPSLPSFASLPNNSFFPDPFTFLDGSPVTTVDDWTCRREEIAALAQEFELGYKPETPYSATTGSSGGNSINVTVNDNGTSISFSCSISYPSSGSAPYPAMIGIGASSLNNSQLSSMGVAVINFPNNEIAQQSGQSSRGVGDFYTMYGSNHSAGALMAWAWGVSRLIDALEKTPSANIDPTRLGVTGCSRNGKGALIAGAFDERIALTIPQESGSGGSSSWRVSRWMLDQGQETQTLCEIVNENVWLRANFGQFCDNEGKLPFDHHSIIGLVAPRAILIIENDILWLGPQSSWSAANAARMIWQALGIPDMMGYSLTNGHNHCSFPSSQQAEVDAYVGKFLVGGGTGNTDIMRNDPGVTFNQAMWVNWTIPNLSKSNGGEEGEGRLASVALPQDFQLEQNYPNPFNPATKIRYSLPQASHVKLQVLSLTGRVVQTLVNGVQNAGRHEVAFDATDLASGLYFYHIRAGSFTQTRRMLFIK